VTEMRDPTTASSYSVSPLLPAARPRIVGIVNITEDSFSDGGLYLDGEAAIAHARRLRAQGADVIELGPASSHPDAARVTAGEERRRLLPVIERLTAEGVPVSVDSYVPDTQRFAIAHGARYLNDIQGFPDENVYAELAAADCRLIVMHSVQRRGPATRVATDSAEIWEGIDRFFEERLAALVAAGVDRSRLVIDPGLGYFLGSGPGPSLTVLVGIGHLRARFGLPVLVSPSRKSFLRQLTGRNVKQVGSASLAAELFAVWQGVNYVRTHDVAALGDALTVLDAIARAGS
jgi:dihydropteroate synthase type 2